MKSHKELNSIVLMKLSEHSHRREYPSARELFNEIKVENPVAVRKGFKSFVKITSSFKQVDIINKQYVLRKQP